MIELKAILAWAGVMAARPPPSRPVRIPNVAVHDEANREQAIFSGSQVLVRQADTLARVMEADPSNTSQINKGVADMRSILAEVARRADR